MLTDEKIEQRLREMVEKEAPDNSLWPENCDGSRRALVIFVGPSPGGTKEIERREINLSGSEPLWNKAYCDPLDWSRGFKVSFQPIVEEIFNKPYDDAAKLIARVNMDWLSNPESQDVSYHYMWEGRKHILPVIYECEPDLIIPMDAKTFGVLQIALYHDGYKINSVKNKSVIVRISGERRNKRYHRNIMAFGAVKEDSSFVVIKSLQHPARIFDIEYGKRVGFAIRSAAKQMRDDDAISIIIE